jgi:hypothetical protein
VHLPGSSSASSAFPYHRVDWSASRFFPANTIFHGQDFRGCSYSVMFRPPSLLASQIVPTAASFPAGQPRLLRPSRTCVVTFARIGYTLRPTTGNWRNEDFHLAGFTALSTAPYSFLVRLFHPLLHAGLSRRTNIPIALIYPEANQFPWAPLIGVGIAIARDPSQTRTCGLR